MTYIVYESPPSSVLFNDDYLFSWDFSDKDCPVVNVSRLRVEPGSSNITVDVIGTYVGRVGVMSVQQLLAKWDREHKNEEKE